MLTRPRIRGVLTACLFEIAVCSAALVAQTPGASDPAYDVVIRHGRVLDGMGNPWILDTAMRAGVMGMTTALIYPPSSYATTDELVEMAKVAGRRGGIYASHIRDEGKDLIAAIQEAITIGERGGLPVEVFHLKAAYQPGWGTLMRAAGETIDAARARGVDVAADMYVSTSRPRCGFRGRASAATRARR